MLAGMKTNGVGKIAVKLAMVLTAAARRSTVQKIKTLRHDTGRGNNMKKYFALLALAAALAAAPSQAADQAGLPGVPQTEKATVTEVGANTGVTVRKVTFKRSNDITLVGNLFLPKDFDMNKHYAAIISVHPAGSVKEQSSGLYAHRLAERGFVTLAFDSAYAGESGGTPHLSEAPYERVEDIRYAIDYLVTLPFIDETRIGALGLCAGGGYAVAAAQTERRISAVGTVSGADIGAANRGSWLGGRPIEEQIKILEDVSAQRTREARGEPLMAVPMCPEPPTEDTAPSFREGYEYYCTPRGMHPRANNRYLRRSQETKMAFSAITNIQYLTQPVLLIAGEKADSIWQSRRIYDALPGKDKEIFTIAGASHIDLYDKPQYVGPAVEKLDGFFKRTLAEK